MKARGYGTPDAYNEMDIQSLKRLAEKHDVAAVLQLADRTWADASRSTASGAPMNSQQKAAVEYYLRAANGGAIVVAGVVAELTLSTGDMVEAAAWNMVASHLKQPVNSHMAATKFQQLSYDQLTQAQARADYISAYIGFRIGSHTHSNRDPTKD